MQPQNHSKFRKRSFILLFFAAVVAALAYTVLWAAMFVCTPRFRSHWDWVWAAGITAVWGSAMLLFVPMLDYTRGYQPTFAAMAEHMPEPSAATVDSFRLGESQIAILDYCFGIRARNVRSAEEARGECLLVQIEHSDHTEWKPGEGWEAVWKGTRPGSWQERYVLYRRVF